MWTHRSILNKEVCPQHFSRCKNFPTAQQFGSRILGFIGFLPLYLQQLRAESSIATIYSVTTPSPLVYWQYYWHNGPSGTGGIHYRRFFNILLSDIPQPPTVWMGLGLVGKLPLRGEKLLSKDQVERQRTGANRRRNVPINAINDPTQIDDKLSYFQLSDDSLSYRIHWRAAEQKRSFVNFGKVDRTRS